MLLDWQMPDLDGLELLRRIKASPTLKHLSVIMQTALSDKSRVADGLAAQLVRLGAQALLGHGAVETRARHDGEQQPEGGEGGAETAADGQVPEEGLHGGGPSVVGRYALPVGRARPHLRVFLYLLSPSPLPRWCS